MILLPIIPILAIITTRLSWQFWPGRVSCLAFWLVIATIHIHSFDWTMAVATGGMALNATVTLANGGFMPGRSIQRTFSIWRRKEGGRLLALGDNYAGCSVGDLLIFAGLLCYATYHIVL